MDKIYIPIFIDDNEFEHDKTETMIAFCGSLEQAYLELALYLKKEGLLWILSPNIDKDKFVSLFYLLDQNTYIADHILNFVSKVESITDFKKLKMLINNFAKDLKPEQYKFYLKYKLYLKRIILGRNMLQKMIEGKKVSIENINKYIKPVLVTAMEWYHDYEIREYNNPLFKELTQIKSEKEKLEQENKMLKEQLLQEQMRPPEQGGNEYNNIKTDFETRSKHFIKMEHPNEIETLKKEIDELKYELWVTKEALSMKNPLYWDDYSGLSNDTRWDMQDDRTEKISEGFQLESFLEEEEKEMKHALAKAICMSPNHSNELLSDEKLLNFVTSLIDTENTSALKEFDEDYLQELELEKNYLDKFVKLTSNH